MKYRSIYITAANKTEAHRIGRALVEEKLAACTNYFPVDSIYRWEGKIEESGEFAIIAKSREELVERIIQRVKELHSYVVPCVVSWVIEKGNPKYLAWISESTD